MKVHILAGGSGGNCIAIQSTETTILVDVGIAKTKIEKRLLDVGIRPDTIKAIFITHAHSDHIKGLPLANKYKIPVYAGEEEWKDIDLVDDELIRTFPLKFVQFDCEKYNKRIVVKPFHVHHDAYEPVGYVVSTDGCKISICLDTGHVDNEMLKAMKDSDIYIIEANHEPAMVEASEYPNSVKARILSHIGHLSNEQTATALAELVQGKGEQIYLTHLSKNNNMPALAEMHVISSLKRKGLNNGEHYQIEVIS